MAKKKEVQTIQTTEGMLEEIRAVIDRSDKLPKLEVYAALLQEADEWQNILDKEEDQADDEDEDEDDDDDDY